MSAKINNSSRAQSVDHLSIEIQSFDFDPSLLDTKVYRRACESSLKREVTLHKSNDEQDPLPSSSALFNNAVADRSDELFDKRDSDVDKVTGHDITPFCDTNQDHTQNMRLCRFLESTRLPRVAGSPLLSEESTRETQFSTIETNLTTSTKATTQFSTSNLRASCEAVYASKAVASRSKVMVTIERVGCDDIELPARCHQYFNVIQDTIFHIRDRILTSNGIEKSRYNIAAAKCTIETHGEHNHKFPLTEAFLNAALEMLDQDAYKAIEIHAIFSLPAKSTGDGAGSIVASKLREGSLTRKWTDDLVAVGSRTWSILRMSFSEDKTDKSLGNSETFIRKGGFSTVFRAELHAASLFHSHLIAVKRLNHTDNEEFWRREVMTLKRIRDAGGHDHVLELLGTFSSEGTGPCLMFPWADGGNLRDYWKLNQPPQDLCSIQWTWRQFTGLASGLQKIHRVLNESCPSSEVSYGRHGDIKPENILWFTQHDESGDGGRLVIADFGLTTFHSNSSQSQNGAGSRPALTPAYRAPEWDIPSLVQREPASSYDIWSLGCVFLEFAVWICEGPDGVDKFRYSR